MRSVESGKFELDTAGVKRRRLAGRWRWMRTMGDGVGS
jgi:hypothetical protein